MSISIQGPATALATLESLTTQANGTGQAGPPASLLSTVQAAGDGQSAIIDINGGLAAATSGASAGLATSASIADAAVSAGTLIEGLLAQMRQDAMSAADPNLDSDSRAALDQGFKSSLAQIQKAVGAAGIAGVNLLDGSVNGTASGAATLTGVNLSLGGPVIGLSADASIADPSSAATIATQLGSAIDGVGRAIGAISAQGQAIEGHLSVIAQAALAGSTGVASAVNPSLDEDGARLAALQVRQQLSASNGSLASAAPNAILSLFQAG